MRPVGSSIGSRGFCSSGVSFRLLLLYNIASIAYVVATWHLSFYPRHYKAGALKAYFKLAKQLIVYLDRVAAGRDYHFGSSKDEGMHMPEDVIELSDEQLKI